MQQRTRRRVWWAAGGVFVVLAGTVAGVLIWLHSDQARPIAVEDVVAEFRAASATSTTVSPNTSSAATSSPSSTSPSTSAPAKLPVGVYVYDTVGDEGVDALGGSDHVYPATTTVTVTRNPDGCVTVRWDALEQRWDESTHCPHRDGWTWRSRTVYHSFFQQHDERAFECTPGSLHLPADLTSTQPFVASCASAGTSESGASTEEITGRVVGFEQVGVGGRPIETVHVHYEVAIGGESTGSASIDRWYAVEPALLMVREVRAGGTSTETPIGTVHYEESYELTLQRLEPFS